MSDDPFEIYEAEKRQMSNFDDKRIFNMRYNKQSANETTHASPDKKKQKGAFLKFTFSGLNSISKFTLSGLNNIGQRLFQRESDLKTLGNENIINTDILKTERPIRQPGDIKDLLQVDRAGRTVIHRAALEQNNFLLADLCTQAQKLSNPLGTIDRKDKFGNTPLLLSCILNITESANKRAKCIDIFTKYGVDVNVKNNRTMWTPVMWCAYYGDTKALLALLKRDARCHFPDHKGHFPIDQAGMKNHRDLVVIIFETVLKEIEFVEKNILSPDIIYARFGESEKYLRTPLHRCSLLYWACYYKLDLSLIEKLLSYQDVVPEFPINCQFNRNSLHACCQSGYTEGLQLLLSTIKSNHEKAIDKQRMSLSGVEHIYGNRGGGKMNRDHFVLPLNKDEKRKFKKKFLKTVQTCSYWYSMHRARISAHTRFEDLKVIFFDGKDIHENTPLHLASYLGYENCAELLLKYGANIEAANNEGWRCKELRSHEAINKLYQKHLADTFKVKKDLTNVIVAKTALELLNFRTAVTLHRMQTNSTVFPENYHHDLTNQNTAISASKKTEKMIVNEIAGFYNQTLIPDVVIKFRIDESDPSRKEFLKQRIDFYLQILLQASFDVYLAPGVMRGTYVVMLKMDDETLSRECSQLGLKMKLLNSYLYEPYDEKRKTEFEPFRSLQRQQIATSVIKKFLDLDLLKEQNVISDFFRMHTLAGAQKLREVWILSSRWYWPQPLGQLRDFLTENRNHNYSAINAMKQYFGEKISFYFAFASFFTCYMLLLAIPGIALQGYLIYRLYKYEDSEVMYDTPLVAIWVIYVMIWNAVTVERWKRKNAEIATRWGLVDAENSPEIIGKQVRKEFVGDECISGTTGALTKKYKVPVTTITFIASVPVLIVLLAGIVGSYILTNLMKQYAKGFNNAYYTFLFELLAGFINGFIIAILNILYAGIARWFVKKENHKYQLYQERSLILKSFTFRFLSSFIGVFYVAFVETDQNGAQNSLWEVFILLLSLVVTRQASAVITLTIIPWFGYKLKQRNFFKSAKRKAMDQAAMEREDHELVSPLKRDEFSNDPNVDKLKRRNTKNNKIPSFKRPVLDLKRGLANQDWDLSQVELNGIRINYKDLVDSYGELFVVLGYITLFASAFPLGPVIAIANGIFDSRSRFYCFLNVLGRPSNERSNGIGNWLEIWEFISIASIFTNLILLYNHVNFGVSNFVVFGQSEDFTKLFIFVVAEHIILLLKYVLAELIPDKPKWVMREEEKYKYAEELEFETIKAREAQLQRTIKEINETLSPSKWEEKMSYAQRELEKALDTIEKLKHEQRMAEASQTKKIENLDLRWAVKTMLYCCFTAIEREITIDRIANIADMNKQNLAIKCTNCTKKKAIIECKKTRELVCKECYFTVQSKLNYADDDIDILPYIGGDGEIDQEIKKEIERVRKIRTQRRGLTKTEDSLGFRWKKFEYYSFPVNNKSKNFHELDRIYKLLYEIYITQSGIDGENKVKDPNKFLKLRTQTSISLDHSSSFSQTLPSIKRSFTIRKSSEKSVFKGELDHEFQKIYAEYREDTAFNHEEKILMNRIAFYVFKRHGANTRFMDFFRIVKGLQEGTFESKIYLFLDLLDEDDDGKISLEDLKRIVRTSYLQSTTLKEECDKVLELIISKDEIIDKKTALHRLFSDPNARAIFSSLLQV